MAFSLISNNRNGFTLIELIIVVAIIGLLAVGIAYSVNVMILRGKQTKAIGDMNHLAKAIRQLELDTLKSPGSAELTPCVYDTYETVKLLNDSSGVGLENDVGFQNWKGPYVEKVPVDPWNTTYYFDTSYRCMQDTKGCEKISDNTLVRALFSTGPDRVEEQAVDVATPSKMDNIVFVLCK